MTEELWSIPATWEWTTLNRLGDIVGGGTPSTKVSEYWGDEVNWISPSDLTGYTSKTIARGAKNLTQAGLDHSGARVMPGGSVHFSSRAPIGYVVISAAPLTTNQGFKSLVPSEGIFNEYVYYYLKSATGMARERASGTTFLELSGAAFGVLPIPIAPTREQRRIVAKIEELFSELDKGIETLTTAREQLKAYRQSVLKHAFDGQLTAGWRKNLNQPNIDGYLTEIGAEVFSEDAPEIPKSWRHVRSGSLFSFITSGSRGWAKYYSDRGAIFIRIGNLDFDTLNLDLCDIQHVSPRESAEGIRTKVQEGDFLISITGYLGMFAIAPKLEEAYVNQHIALSRPKDGFDREYVGYYFISKTGGHHYLNALTKGAVKAGLGLDDIRKFPIPLCSLEEQKVVVNLIKEKLSIVASLEADIQMQLETSRALRQSILKKAFFGQLVAQCPNDEPASVLLERIRAGRDSAPTENGRNGRNSHAKSNKNRKKQLA